MDIESVDRYCICFCCRLQRQAAIVREERAKEEKSLVYQEKVASEKISKSEHGKPLNFTRIKS